MHSAPSQVSVRLVAVRDPQPNRAAQEYTNCRAPGSPVAVTTFFQSRTYEPDRRARSGISIKNNRKFVFALEMRRVDPPSCPMTSDPTGQSCLTGLSAGD
jgi:hypothetical protein